MKQVYAVLPITITAICYYVLISIISVLCNPTENKGLNAQNEKSKQDLMMGLRRIESGEIKLFAHKISLLCGPDNQL